MMKRIFLILASVATLAHGQGGITSSTPIRDKTFYPERYGAKPDDGVNDKAQIQACIDAAEAAGGGTVYLNEGVWEIHPLTTGLGLLINGDKVHLVGAGPKTILRAKSATASTAFALIAPRGYNTTTTNYGASGLWVENLRVECDTHTAPTFTAAVTDIITQTAHGYAEGQIIQVRSGTTLPAGLSAATNYYVRYIDANTYKVSLTLGGAFVDITTTGTGTHYVTDVEFAAGLIDIVHAPWAVVRGVTFGSVCFHQMEIQGSKNVLVDNCTFSGSTQGSRVQFDAVGGSAALRTSYPPYAVYTQNVRFQNCSMAAKNVDGITATNVVLCQVELDHTGNQLLRNCTFEDCEFGPVYDFDSTSANYYGIAINSVGGLSRMENLIIRECRFLGNTVGAYMPIYLPPTTGVMMHGVTIENNFFGSGYDCDGMRCEGGFYRCIIAGSGISGVSVTGGSGTTTTDYQYRRGITIRGNRFQPRFTQGLSAVTSGVCDVVEAGPALDAVIENNSIFYPANGAALTSANTSTEELTFSTAHRFEVGDAVRFSSVASLQFSAVAVGTTTTYYVISVPSLTTLLLSTTLGGTTVNVTTSGTGNLAIYRSTSTLTFQCGFVVCGIGNLKLSNNLVHCEHDTSVTSNLVYAFLTDFSGLESGSIPGYVEMVNNRCVEIGAGSCQSAFAEYSGVASGSWGAGGPFVRGNFEGNIVSGTWTTSYSLAGHPWWLTDGYTWLATADSTAKTNATLAAVTGATINLLPAGTNIRYRVDGEIFYTTPAATDGIQLALDLPAGSTASLVWTLTTADTGEFTETAVTTDNGPVATTARPATGTIWRARVQGYMTGGTSGGQVILNMACEVAGTASTVVKAGSYLTVKAQ